MTRCRSLTLVLIALLAVGCGPEPPAAVQLVVMQAPVGGRLQAGVRYTEGAVAFVEVRGPDGRVVASTSTQRYLAPIEVLRIRIPPGRYELASGVRPCSAACPRVDPPTDTCSAPVELGEASSILVVVLRQVGRPCTIVAPG